MQYFDIILFAVIAGVLAIRLYRILGIKSKVIIRTGIGSERPLHPQHQHIGDFTDAFQSIFTNIEIIRLENSNEILKSYKKAYRRKDNKSTLLVEVSDFYNEK